jgi:hypothetical protein
MGWPGQLALEACAAGVAEAEWDELTAAAWEAALGWLPHDATAPAEIASKKTASDLFSIA